MILVSHPKNWSSSNVLGTVTNRSDTRGTSDTLSVQHMRFRFAKVPPVVECLLNLRFSWLRSVTYFSVCRRLLRPGVKSPDQDIHFAERCCPPTGTGILEILSPSSSGLTCKRKEFYSPHFSDLNAFVTAPSPNNCLRSIVSSYSCLSLAPLDGILYFWDEGLSLASKYIVFPSTLGLDPFATDFSSSLKRDSDEEDSKTKYDIFCNRKGRCNSTTHLGVVMGFH